MATISLFAPHHDPHRSPLRNVDRLDDVRNLVTERDRACNVVDDVDVSDLLPRHRHVLQKLHQRVRHVFQRAEVHALVVAVLSRRHVSVIFDDFSNMLWRHVFFLSVDESKLSLFSISFGLHLMPSSGLLI